MLPLLFSLLPPAQIDPIRGFTTNRVLMTEDTTPPTIHSFNLYDYTDATVFEYTIDDVVELGVPRLHEGQNRTCRPAGLVLLQGRFSDAIYWADAGVGAILGLRFDSSGLRAMAHGLVTPEPMALDTSEGSDSVLYWADLSTNKIQSCTIQGDETNGAGLSACQSLSIIRPSDCTSVADSRILSSPLLQTAFTGLMIQSASASD